MADDPEAPKPVVEDSSDNEPYHSDDDGGFAVKDDERFSNVSLIDRAVVDEWRKQQEELRQLMEK